MQGTATLIAAVATLVTALCTGIAALIKSRRTSEDLLAVKTQVTPTNGEPLAKLVEEGLEHLRSTSRRIDLHDEILVRIANAIDELKEGQSDHG